MLNHVIVQWVINLDWWFTTQHKIDGKRIYFCYGYCNKTSTKRKERKKYARFSKFTLKSPFYPISPPNKAHFKQFNYLKIPLTECSSVRGISLSFIMTWRTLGASIRTLMTWIRTPEHENRSPTHDIRTSEHEIRTPKQFSKRFPYSIYCSGCTILMHSEIGFYRVVWLFLTQWNRLLN